MFSISELLIIYIILILNLLIIAVFRKKITIIVTIIISNLIAILFYNIAISNQQIAKELIIITIIYSIVILALITNFNFTDSGQKSFEAKTLILAIITTIIISSGIFVFVKNIRPITNFKPTKEIQLKKNNENNQIYSDFYKKTLQKEIIFQRSGTMMMIIIAIMTVLLLNSQNMKNKTKK